MIPDKELLELAAKAAGYRIDGWTIHGVPYQNGMFDSINQWNPLTDDGDALRLVIKLRMMVDVGGGGFCTADIEGLGESVNEVATPDSYAATRRAIVRAAAEIGRSIK